MDGVLEVVSSLDSTRWYPLRTPAYGATEAERNYSPSRFRGSSQCQQADGSVRAAASRPQFRHVDGQQRGSIRASWLADLGCQKQSSMGCCFSAVHLTVTPWRAALEHLCREGWPMRQKAIRVSAADVMPARIASSILMRRGVDASRLVEQSRSHAMHHAFRTQPTVHSTTGGRNVQSHHAPSPPVGRRLLTTRGRRVALRAAAVS